MKWPQHLEEYVEWEKLWDSRLGGEVQVQRIKRFIEHGMTLDQFKDAVYLPYAMGLTKAKFDDNSTTKVCVTVSVCVCLWVCMFCSCGWRSKMAASVSDCEKDC